MVLSSWQSHCESSPSSFDECRMAPSVRRPKTKPDDLGCESACTGCQKLHPPMKTFINESKSVKIHEKSRISQKHRNGRFSRKEANFTENVTAMKSWIRLVPSHMLSGIQCVSNSNLSELDSPFSSSRFWTLKKNARLLRWQFMKHWYQVCCMNATMIFSCWMLIINCINDPLL